MRAQSFVEAKENIRQALGMRPVQLQKSGSIAKEYEKKGEVTEEYPDIGDRWQGPIYGAPYPHPRLEAQNVYKIPGRRADWIDIFKYHLKKKFDYYRTLALSGLYGAATVAILVSIAMPYTAIAIPFGGMAMYYWHRSWKWKAGNFLSGRNYAVMKNINTDSFYPPVAKPPFLIKEKFIWD